MCRFESDHARPAGGKKSTANKSAKSRKIVLDLAFFIGRLQFRLLVLEHKMKFAISFFLGFLARIICNVFVKVFSDHWRAFSVYRLWPRCEHCGTMRGLALEDSRTCYPTKYDDPFEETRPDDPNRSQLLCRSCAVDHHEYWDEMWKDYYSGRL